MQHKRKYIDLTRFRLLFYGYKAKLMSAKYIHRFMKLLNIIAPNKYELNLLYSMATIESKETGLTAVRFSENPFQNGSILLSDFNDTK